MLSLDTAKGLGACAVSTLLFGSMFVPVKQQDPGDGFMVQWTLDVAIFMVGLVINAYTGFQKFYPLAMLGGMFWAIGNAMAIPILQILGLGLGILLWNVTNCLCGWMSSRFGLFGLKANVPSNLYLNYSGLALIILGGILFSTIKPSPKGGSRNEQGLPVEEIDMADSKMLENDTQNDTNKNTAKRKIFGIILALISGVFYGSTFVPVIYIQEHPDQFPGAPTDALPYVFAHFTGILVTGTVIMIIYAIYKRNRPFVNNRVILPAYVTGTMWAIAQTSWFIANDYIAQSISFPINSMVPGVIASLWSVLYYREIRGKKNLRMFAGAMLITIAGAIMVGLSKDL